MNIILPGGFESKVFYLKKYMLSCTDMSARQVEAPVGGLWLVVKKMPAAAVRRHERNAVDVT
jgi:hypothetical protein